MTHKEYLKKIGIEIRVAKIRAGMSTAQVAKATGLSTAAINNIENGKSDTKILTYKRIVDALGVDLKDIF